MPCYNNKPIQVLLTFWTTWRLKLRMQDWCSQQELQQQPCYSIHACTGRHMHVYSSTHTSAEEHLNKHADVAVSALVANPGLCVETHPEPTYSHQCCASMRSWDALASAILFVNSREERVLYTTCEQTNKQTNKPIVFETEEWMKPVFQRMLVFCFLTSPCSAPMDSHQENQNILGAANILIHVPTFTYLPLGCFSLSHG